MQPKKINKQQFDELLASAKIVNYAENQQPKVLYRKSDDHIIKIFWAEPYAIPGDRFLFRRAKRFIRYSKRLAGLGVQTISVAECFLCDEIKAFVLVYPAVKGVSIGECLKQENHEQLLIDFAQFVATLHKKRIYFRAGHEGNYLYDADDHVFRLIDVDNTRFMINYRRRVKNLAYLFAHANENEGLFGQEQIENFLKAYFAACHYSMRKREDFRFRLKRELRKRKYQG